MEATPIRTVVDIVTTTEGSTEVEVPEGTFEPVSALDPSPRYYRLGKDGEKIAIKRSEYKKSMHDTFTVKHPLIPMCGHGLVREHEPRHRNCESCWFCFFQTFGTFTQSCEEVVANHGPGALKQLRGPKLTKNFLKFMSTVAQYKQAMDRAKQDAVTETT